jgi:four helix bundle protein
MVRDAVGEANEMINHLAFAFSRSYITKEKADELIDRYHILGKKLSNLKEKWRNF